MRRVCILVLFLILVFILSSCAPGPNDAEKTPNRQGKVSGFWKGLWHGIISPITFVISIFTKSVRFYEVHNSGFWYNLGFVIGAGILFNGGLLGGRLGKKKKEI